MELFGAWTIYVCGGFFVLILGGLGLFLVIHSQRSKSKALQSQSWPEIKGLITESRIKEKSDPEMGTSYTPIVRYNYQVEGVMYEGKRIAFGSGMEFNIWQKAAEYLKPYPVDTEVSVFYNPDNPSDSVLIQVAQRTTVGLVIGIILLAITLCLVCLMGSGIVRLITN